MHSDSYRKRAQKRQNAFTSCPSLWFQISNRHCKHAIRPYISRIAHTAYHTEYRRMERLFFQLCSFCSGDLSGNECPGLCGDIRLPETSCTIQDCFSEFCSVTADNFLIPPERVFADSFQRTSAFIIHVNIDKAIALFHFTCAC